MMLFRGNTRYDRFAFRLFNEPLMVVDDEYFEVEFLVTLLFVSVAVPTVDRQLLLVNFV